MTSIILKPHEVRGFRAGRQTQIRRLFKTQPPSDWQPVVGIYRPLWMDKGGYVHRGEAMFGASDENFSIPFPYAPGQVLAVREAWAIEGAQLDSSAISKQDTVAYMADHPGDPKGLGWRSAATMPLWASRMSLTVVAVRCERLQSISEADARAEGVEEIGRDWRNYLPKIGRMAGTEKVTLAKDSYRSLWNATHGPGSWDANPWVIVTEFQPFNV